MTKISITKLVILFSLFSAFCLTASSQTAQVAQKETAAKIESGEKTPRDDDAVQARVRQLEAQVAAMQAQLDALRNMVEQAQKTPAAQTKTAETVAASSKPAETAVAKTAESVKTAEPAKTAAQQKQLGVDIGSARLTPYGTIYFNAFGDSGGTNNADVPLFATPTGTGNVSASVRQTRLGVRLEGARVGGARLTGIVEADFFGGFPSVGIGENFGVVRVRLANARLDWEKTAVTVGQDWMVFAPVNPTSLAAAAIPQMAAAGNPWARLPQVKVERKLGNNFTWAGAVLAPQTGDFATNAAFFLQPTSGAASRVPYLQTRFAATGKDVFGTKKPGSVGVSAHYGRSSVPVGATRSDVDSYGVALDWNFPLATTLNLAGEAFFGENLGGFQAGIFQSYNTDFARLNGSILAPAGVRAIRTRGGWAQLGFTPRILQNRFSIYGSFGLDDPRDEDLTSTTRRDFRERNLSYAFDAIFRVTPQFSLGAEFRRLQTDYVFSGRRNANHVNLGATYSF